MGTSSANFFGCMFINIRLTWSMELEDYFFAIFDSLLPNRNIFLIGDLRKSTQKEFVKLMCWTIDMLRFHEKRVKPEVQAFGSPKIRQITTGSAPDKVEASIFYWNFLVDFLFGDFYLPYCSISVQFLFNFSSVFVVIFLFIYRISLNNIRGH